jgi:hypothetical protein
MRPNHPLRQRSDEDGIGAIGTSLGAVMLLGLLLVALHALLALQTRTLVSAAAWDAARAVAVARTDGGSNAPEQAQQRVVAMIPGLSPETRVVVADDSVSVTVIARSPGFFPGVTSFDSVRTVTRTAVMRREALR